MSWLRKLLCSHHYEKVGELKDNDDDPKAVNIVRMCCRCGDVQSTVLTAPEDTTCPPHVWTTFHQVRILGEDQTKAVQEGRIARDKVIPIGFAFQQQCTRCGELREVKL